METLLIIFFMILDMPTFYLIVCFIYEGNKVDEA